jgi:hypothetical protein
MNAGADAAPAAQFPIPDEATANYFLAPDVSTARFKTKDEAAAARLTVEEKYRDENRTRASTWRQAEAALVHYARSNRIEVIDLRGTPSIAVHRKFDDEQTPFSLDALAKFLADELGQ